MHGASQQPVRPVVQHVADVHEDRWRGVAFRAWRVDWDGCEGWGGGGREDLESGLPWTLEEEGDGAVVGVRAGADVEGRVGRGDGGVVEQAEGGSGWAVGVSGC